MLLMCMIKWFELELHTVGFGGGGGTDDIRAFDFLASTGVVPVPNVPPPVDGPAKLFFIIKFVYINYIS